MATRVKKLARQLERPPVEVLGLLHAMGYVRFKSAQDMVGDDVIERLRREMRAGLAPLDLEVRRVPKKPVLAPLPIAPTAPQSPKPAAPTVSDEAVVALQAQLAAAGAQRDETFTRLQEALATVQQLREQAAAHQVERDALRAAVDAAEEAARAAESVAEDSEPSGPVLDGDAIVAALQARGLRGDDEYERALGALAGKRVLRELLALLTVRDAAEVERVLERRLLLVGDAISEDITGGAAVVAVAAERAEVPGGAQLEKLVKRVGEQCLLSGLRRITMVGLPPLWHRLLSVGLDPRVELRVAHGIQRSPEQARSDLDGSDGVVLLNVVASPEADEVYATSKVWSHRSTAADFTSFLDGWVVGLRED